MESVITSLIKTHFQNNAVAILSCLDRKVTRQVTAAMFRTFPIKIWSWIIHDLSDPCQSISHKIHPPKHEADLQHKINDGPCCQVGGESIQSLRGRCGGAVAAGAGGGGTPSAYWNWDYRSKRLMAPRKPQSSMHQIVMFKFTNSFPGFWIAGHSTLPLKTKFMWRIRRSGGFSSDIFRFKS